MFETPHFSDFRVRRAGQIAGLAAVLGAFPGSANAEELSALQGEFEVFAERYCVECHGPDNAEAELDLEAILQSPGGFLAHQNELVLSFDAIDFGDMPPRRATQPSDEERAKAVETLLSIKRIIEAQTQGDPGKVVMPRLTPSEYDRVLRDLAGRPVKAGFLLPNDGGAGEGFSNVGEAQPMSLRHIEQFLNAARFAQQSLIATPSGLYWHHQALASIDKEEDVLDRLDTAMKQELQLIENRLRDEAMFLNRTVRGQERHDKDAVTKLYLEAAWKYRYRADLGMPNATIREIANTVDPRLSEHSLAEWIAVLAHPKDEWFELTKRHYQRWRDLPPPSQIEIAEVRTILDEIDPRWTDYPHIFLWPLNQNWDYEINLNSGKDHESKHLEIVRDEYRWPFNIDLERYRKRYQRDHQADWKEGDPVYMHLATTIAADNANNDVIHWQNGRFIMSDDTELPWDEFVGNGLQPVGHVEAKQGDSGMVVRVQAPAEFHVRVPEGAQRFEVDAKVAPAQKGKATVQVLISPKDLSEEERVWYSGRRPLFLRDSEPGKTYLNQASASQAFRRSENKNIDRERERHLAYLSESSLAKLRKSGARKPDPEEAYPYYFSTREIYEMATPKERQQLEQLTRIYDQTVLTMDTEVQPDLLGKMARDQLAALMPLAWKRPVAPEEVEEIATLFDATYATTGIYDTAFKQALSGVMVSPNFIYRLPASTEIIQASAQDGVRPLTGLELASRLSFALWASLPDAELLQLAQSGELLKEEVLQQQVQRMMADPRADAMAVEFAGQWFQFSTFASHSEPDPELFPEFDAKLAQAMYDEVRLFFTEIFLKDRSILNVLDADFTYVNEDLATKVYGMEGIEGSQMRRVEINDPKRGGVLTMGATLTKTSLALRTSAVKRGVFVIEEILGAHLPDPPPVPALSQAETNEDGLNVVEQLKVHREDPSCAACHSKFDPLGIALENFDPIGRWRNEDAGGNPVINTDVLPDGTVLDGPAALRDMLKAEQDRFLHHFARKLTGYLLGRAVTVGDSPLLESIKTALRENDFRPSAAIQTIVQSRQFTHTRVPEFIEEETTISMN